MGPMWFLVLVTVLVILAILWLLGIRVNVGYVDKDLLNALVVVELDA